MLISDCLFELRNLVTKPDTPSLPLTVAAPIQERGEASIQSAGGGGPAMTMMDGVKAVANLVMVKDRKSSGIVEK